MNCIANAPLESRRFNIIAVALFIFFIALQSGYSQQNSGSPYPVNSRTAPAPPLRSLNVWPFSHFAVGATAGTLGIGVEVATSLSRRTNLRVDGHFFNYSQTYVQDGISYNGNLHLRDLRASYDFFPFDGGFRVSGGLAVYNQLKVRALALVPPNTSISLDTADYFSSAADPLHGNATIAYGNKVAPTFTFGWGNAIPRSGRHLAFPVEFGTAFAGTPKFNLTEAGSACATRDPATCQTVSTYSGFQSDLAAERRRIDNKIAPYRFYPILNVGVTYRY